MSTTMQFAALSSRLHRRVDVDPGRDARIGVSATVYTTRHDTDLKEPKHVVAQRAQQTAIARPERQRRAARQSDGAPLRRKTRDLLGTRQLLLLQACDELVARVEIRCGA